MGHSGPALGAARSKGKQFSAPRPSMGPPYSLGGAETSPRHTAESMAPKWQHGDVTTNCFQGSVWCYQICGWVGHVGAPLIMQAFAIRGNRHLTPCEVLAVGSPLIAMASLPLTCGAQLRQISAISLKPNLVPLCWLSVLDVLLYLDSSFLPLSLYSFG